MTVGMLRQVILYKQKKQRLPHRTHPLPFDKWNCQVFINFEKCKILTTIEYNTSWIISKKHICGSKFHVCYHFFRYKNPRRKNFIQPSCPKHSKIINWNKKWDKFLFSHFFVVPQEVFIFLKHQKEVWK